MNVFSRQEFFEDVRALFGSLAFRAEGSGNTNNNVRGGKGDTKVRAAREVNLRILLDQLQVMKAEPRNQLRYHYALVRYKHVIVACMYATLCVPSSYDTYIWHMSPLNPRQMHSRDNQDRSWVWCLLAHKVKNNQQDVNESSA